MTSPALGFVSLFGLPNQASVPRASNALPQPLTPPALSQPGNPTSFSRHIAPRSTALAFARVGHRADLSASSQQQRVSSPLCSDGSLAWGVFRSALEEGGLSATAMRLAESDIPDVDIPELESMDRSPYANKSIDPAALESLKSFVADPAQQPLSEPAYAAYLDFYNLDQSTAGTERTLQSIPVGSDQIAMQTFRQPEGAAVGEVMIVHGFQDHVGVYDQVIKSLVDQGFTVHAFDFQGHGLSTGDSCMIGSFKQYDQALEAVIGQVDDPSQLKFIAHSTGAAVLSNRFSDKQESNRSVLIGPLVKNKSFEQGKRVFNVAKKYMERKGLSVQEFKKAVPGNVTIDTGYKPYLEFANSDPLRGKELTVSWFGSLLEWLDELPSKPGNDDIEPLVIQGSDDEVVDAEYNVDTLQQKFPQLKLHNMTGVGHQIMNERPDVVSELNQLITDYLQG